jgi:AAA domain
VRTRIAELFRTYGAALIPAYIGDVVAAQAPETARAWLQHRWQTNRPVTNPFESRIFDQTLFQGQQDVVQRYAPELLSADAVAIHGAPGAGKSSLLRRLQSELRSDAEFVWLSCSFLPPGSAAAEFLRRAAETFQTPYEVVNGVPVDSFTAGLTKFLGDAGNKPSRTVIVLDDADVLVAPALYGMTPADIQFFEDLKHQIDLALRGHGISFVFVGLRTFMLTREEIDGVSNPLRPYVLPLRVPPLNKADVGSICDLGKQVDLYFEPEAVERVYYWSSGNAHVVQMMCGKILENSPKNELTTVTEAMVDSAARELISARQTLERRVMPGLTAIERKILAVVARFSISKPIDFEWALPDVPDEQVGNALDCLVEIGVLSRRGGKTKVEGPLLEAWVKTHMQLPEAAKNERRNRQIRLATLGAVMSILAFTVGGLAFAAGEQFVLSPEVGGCTMKVKLPKRVEAKGTLEIMLFRRCRSPKTGLVELGKRAETRAEFFAPGVVKGERKAIAWHVEDADDSESFTVRNIDGIAPYWFGLNYSADQQPKKEVLLFSVEKNWLSALPNGAQTVMVAAGALPTLIGLLLAFYGDVRRLLGKFFEGSGKAP